MLDPELVYAAYTGIPQAFRRAMLTEYLQCKALGYIFNAAASKSLVFMGGTALRIFYGTNRFSEDLDFDSGNLSSENLIEIAELTRKRFLLEGVECETTVKNTGAFSAVFRFTGILQKWELTGHRDEVLKLKFDAEPQNFSYTPELRILNRFDVTASVRVASDSLILAQKLHAILERKGVMGRDLYDAAYLFGRTTPDMEYIKCRQNTDNRKQLSAMILSRLSSYSMRSLASDVAPFLQGEMDVRKVELFPEIIGAWAESAF